MKEKNYEHGRQGYSLFRSTFFRIIITVVILVLPINLFTLYLTIRVVRNNQEQLRKEIEDRLTISVNRIDDELTRASRQITYLSYGNVDFQAFTVEGKKNSYNEIAGHLSSVKTVLGNLLQDYPFLDLIYFQFPKTGYTITSGFPGISSRSYKELIEEDITNSEDASGMHWEYRTIDDASILFSHASWNHADFGVIINLEWLLDKISMYDSEEKKYVFFTNGERTLFTEEGMSFLQEHNMTIEQLERSEKYVVCISTLDNYDLSLIEVTERDSLLSQHPKALIMWEWVAVLLLVAVIPLLLYQMNKLVNQPLRKLVVAIDKVEQGDLAYRIEPSGAGKEFEQINTNFNQMLDQVSELKIHIYEEELKKKDIRMQYLSQQIQQHFILNAMNILYSYEPEEYRLSRKMIMCIAKYYRYIVKMDSEYVELQQEMDHIKNYFEIQKARFPKKLFTIVEYDEKIRNALIPPLLIQNLAENSIKYSMKPEGTITIFVIAECLADNQEKMRIRIVDTGDGISDELCRKIAAFQRTGIPQEGLGVGIQNTIERLKYFYPENSSICIENDKVYSGTNMEIILPVRWSEVEE